MSGRPEHGGREQPIDVVVKFREGGRIWQDRDHPRQIHASHLDLERFHKVLEDELQDDGEARVILSYPQDPDALQEKRRRAEESLGHRVPYLNLFVRVRVSDPKTADRLLAGFLDDDEIEYSYPAPVMRPASPTPDLTASQGYLEPGPKGVDARHAGAIPGGSGSWIDAGGEERRVRVFDWEWGFNPSHEDLPAVEVKSDLPVVSEEWVRHGTATLGVIGAVRQETATSPEQGMVGIAYGAKLLFASVAAAWSPEAIGDAVVALDPGDVILFEVEVDDANGNAGPAELAPELRAAILTATGNDVTVIEAAGNGNTDLAKLEIEVDGALVKPFDETADGYEETLAVMVGAGYPVDYPGKNARSKVNQSNYGERVDCQATGKSVAAPGIGISLQGGDEDARYGDSFGNTSAASAIIAGVAACIQGAARAAPAGSFVTPEDMRALLGDVSNGWPQQDNASFPASTHPIGPQPDLAKLLSAPTLEPHVVMRDTLPEPGPVPPARSLRCRCPDLIVRAEPSCDPEAEFGNAAWFSRGLSEDMLGTPDNYVYARVENRGGQRTDASVGVYWTPAAPYLPAAEWNLLGTLEADALDAGERRVLGPIRWEHPPDVDPGPRSLIAVVSTPDVPVAIPDAVASAEEFLDFLEESDRIRFRSVCVVPARADEWTDWIRVGVAGLPEVSAAMRLRVVNRLPPGTEVRIGRADNLLPGPDVYEYTIPDRRRIRLGRFEFEPWARHMNRIRLRLPHGTGPGRYRVALRQLRGNRQLGRYSLALVVS